MSRTLQGIRGRARALATVLARKARKRSLSTADCGLAMDIDVHGWLKDHPIYCPVPWCKAHNLRYERCGDEQGPYEGLHIARLAYVERWTAIERSRVNWYRGLGCSLADARLSAGISRQRQDAIDLGLCEGKRGVRRPL